MEQWLLNLPKSVLALGAIVIVLVMMILTDPPKSECDTQMETVEEVLKTNFYKAREDGWSFKSSMTDKYSACLKANSLGGCITVIQRMAVFEKQMRKVPDECSAHELVAAKKQTYSMGIKLLAQLAWGTEPPGSPFAKTGWLDASSLALYCRLKREYSRLYGADSFESLQEGVMRSLPEAKGLERKDLWEKSLFSLPCGKYL